jgi:hypothetical protein
MDSFFFDKIFYRFGRFWYNIIYILVVYIALIWRIKGDRTESVLDFISSIRKAYEGNSIIIHT